MSLLKPDAKIYVAGHRGMVGSAIWRTLEAHGFANLVGWGSESLDLRDQQATEVAIMESQPEVLVLAAAKVGGIMANATQPVEFLQDNLRIQSNVFQAAHKAGVDRLLFLGSSCIYPKLAPQPISEEALLTGPLEQTNEAYAVAKISGIVAVRAYRREYGRRWISAMPTNLYGPHDNFDLTSSHVLPALIRRFHEAKDSGLTSVTLWGSGSPMREFLHVDDLANACIHLLQCYDDSMHINVGSGKDIAIRDLAALISEIVGFQGDIQWDESKPDGTPRKLLNVDRIRGLGWKPAVDLAAGIAATYEWYLAHYSSTAGS